MGVFQRLRENKLIIGSRGSDLALTQSRLVKSLLLEQFPELDVTIKVIQTSGDKILNQNLNTIGGKGLFIKEIEEQLLDHTIDIAVHSLKDMPASFPDALTISTTLEREDPRDALISTKYDSIAALPKGAIVGTSSPRRASQALYLRPDLNIVMFRGNVPTRLKKVENGDVDASFLAMAGLNRLNIEHTMIRPIDSNEFIPAIAQGIIGIEVHKDNEKAQHMLNTIHNDHSFACATAERQFLAAFEASCNSPIGALATLEGETLHLKAMIGNPDGSELITCSKSGDISQSSTMVQSMVDTLKNKGKGVIGFA